MSLGVARTHGVRSLYGNEMALRRLHMCWDVANDVSPGDDLYSRGIPIPRVMLFCSFAPRIQSMMCAIVRACLRSPLFRCLHRSMTDVCSGGFSGVAKHQRDATKRGQFACFSMAKQRHLCVQRLHLNQLKLSSV